ncbi:3-deoxy-manno-octulosonate cytidylyltransferase [Porticoccaceae bacterium]|jgi:3-deoxy-manno-octulosonate cytidylyltransferase (CMP-KDO synthetase)|nr:3-deoxy-manno-octulosonate cytidylyltransferase [Porticoccaceae bacterium]MDC1476880.1 3-deoxy-manno-octulosonate cytidylyltransferase [Porticoccaceae bacterium]CAI8341563.1 MAG: 3-deoxy-manno-octulosonate cytidylyltransferase [SAR92 bacterium MED-G29]|tara:strand:+ start:1423 stop:2184 length:762 start_codon:yes stop_codon:yes gene_type:complete
MQFIVVIPARYASTRLPGKPLRDIAGLPMIQRVWQQACKSGAARVVIATDDSRIEAAALAFGAEVCMTRADHVSGTDRLQEVAQQLGLDSSQIVVNVQGDEPLIPPRVIDQVASNLAANEQAGVATLCEPIESVEDFCNPNVVKVVTDVQGLARYFSRAPIPWPRDHFQESQNSMPDLDLARRHIGIYAYRVAELTRFVSWAVAPIERSESLEQLRFIWNSVGIHIADAIEPVPGGIDTEQDLESAIKIIKSL